MVYGLGFFLMRILIPVNGLRTTPLYNPGFDHGHMSVSPTSINQPIFQGAQGMQNVSAQLVAAASGWGGACHLAGALGG